MGGFLVNAQDLLTRVEDLGIVLCAEGDRIRFRPKDAVPAGLLEELLGHKAELLELLRVRASSVAGAVPGKVEAKKWPLTAAQILEMPLSEFADARRVVEVFSQVLDETVIFASDNAAVDPGERRVVYRAAELKKLIGVCPEDLTTVHEIKRVFGGTIRPN